MDAVSIAMKVSSHWTYNQPFHNNYTTNSQKELKIMTIQIKVRYGAVNSCNKEAESGTTVGSVINDPNVQGLLGYGDNIRVLLNGVVVSNDFRLSGDALLSVEDQAARKA
jgi:hypothetical protein